MVKTFGTAIACSSECSTKARTRLGVASGRSVIRSPSLSVNAYISFWTMSVVSPVPLANSSSRSMTGVRISA